MKKLATLFVLMFALAACETSTDETATGTTTTEATVVTTTTEAPEEADEETAVSPHFDVEYEIFQEDGFLWQIKDGFAIIVAESGKCPTEDEMTVLGVAAGYDPTEYGFASFGASCIS